MSDPAPPPAARIDVGKARTRLTFFKVMAFVVGIGLLVLCLEMVLHYGFDNNALDWWPQPHGFIFIVYVLATVLLGFELRWPLGRTVLVVLAGCVPFLSFWVERKVSRESEATLAGAGTQLPAR
ncbi:DUF3817 domain-containing protein [Luteipulveratus sp. YIM 133132]|uniref:DUF3817 domain-containing protein n=1 Tax=Luteipulveratus flavus TaxID=3031728 RepID=UPI0023B1D010|nr:DUF3817 domain-containing protein [Luteipulveratus sp. YIM 133132]MDE9367151.1 DUF3817 domain-containing protein [Luteipulveratus sp. YIM 133132]